MLEHQTDGYFTNDMLIDQVRRAIPIFEKKYPVAQGAFIFDHAPSHVKRPDDALNAERMNASRTEFERWTERTRTCEDHDRSFQ